MGKGSRFKVVHSTPGFLNKPGIHVIFYIGFVVFPILYEK